MGHKVHPKAFRLFTVRTWDANWFARRPFAALLREDVRIREFLKGELREALLDRIDIERTRQQLTITIHAAKPGVAIGRGGAGVEDMKRKLKEKFFRGRPFNVNFNIKEVAHPSLSACVVAQQIATDLERRMPFRRVLKQAIERVLKARAEGVKVSVGGRLNGSEIARTETLAQGKVPLHNMRADIDFASVAARTVYGAIGVKVWINRGEVFATEIQGDSVVPKE